MDDDDVTIADGGPGPRRPPLEEPPAGYGRYEVRELIGRGGMGAVYSGVDSVLGREVAIKVISDRRDPTRVARLVREAQALAALSHPNVVTVYEVGKQGVDHFIAMERVRGIDLDAWFGQRPGWEKVLDVLRRAGEGLAAAHHSGLVHRDFKPANVILGDDGRPRVLDFGLVMAEGPDAVSTASRDDDDDDVPSSESLTRDGVVMGTPAYMAPEQLAADDVGPAADQWAFCVTLYEGIYGRRPFAAQGLKEMMRAIGQGLGARPETPPIPAWLWRALRRGLRRRASDRWPSMEALLAALRPPRRGRLVLGATAVVGVGVALAWPRGASEDAGCRDAGQRIAQTWNDDARGRVRGAFAGAEMADGADVIVARLDEAASAFEAVHSQVCPADGGRSAAGEHFDDAMRCLAQRQHELDEVVTRLDGGEASVLARAGNLLDGVSPASQCLDVDRLAASMVPPDETTATRVAEVREQLARVETMLLVDRLQPARELSKELLDDAVQIGYAPLVAEAQVTAGTAMGRTGDTEAARQLLSDAYWNATAAEHGAVATRAAYFLMDELLQGGQYDEALDWARHARSALGRTPSLRQAGATIDRKEASVLARMGRYGDAEARIDRALQALVAEDDRRETDIAWCLGLRGHIARMKGDHPRAIESLRTAVTTLESHYGPHHSQVGSSLVNLGLALLDGEKTEEGRDVLERAVVIQGRIHGPEHRTMPPGLMALAHAHRRLGNTTRAREMFERAERIYEHHWGPDTVNVAYALEGLARVEMAEGGFDDAVRQYERVVQLRSGGRLAPSWTAQAQFGLAKALRAAGRESGRAEALAREALAVYEGEGTAREEDAEEVRVWLADADGDALPDSATR